MTPMTPLIDTPTGRLAELVQLLSDTSLSTAFGAVETATNGRVESRPETVADPLWIVAGALVEVRASQRRQMAERARAVRSRNRIPVPV